jgi:hypothetical protein
MFHFKAGRDHTFAMPYAIQLGMVKIGQTFSTSRSKMDLAVGRRNEEETDLRVRHLR